MRKTSKALLVALIASGMILSSCQVNVVPSDSSAAPSSSEPEVVQTGIEIANAPSKKDYFVGETFDASGLVVVKVMSDGNKSLLAASDYQVSSPDMLTAGAKEVTVTSGAFSAKFSINVKAIEAASIAITKNPTKMVYFVGEEFSADGLEVTASYNNGSSKVLAASEYTLSEPDMSAAGEVDVTVTFGSLTASFSINIVEAQILSIEVFKMPTAVKYERKQDFDSTGLVIAGVQDNGKKVDVTKQCVLSKPDMESAGKKTIFVALEELGLSTSFEIEVAAPRRVKPVIENFPDKVSYELGETVDFSGLKVSYLLTDGSYEEIPDIYYTLSDAPSTAESGQKTVTITFKTAIDIEAGVVYNGDGLGEDAAFEAAKYETLTFSIGVIGAANYTYNDFTSVSPSNWNELTYQDANDTQIMNFISGSFFNYNFKFDDQGKVIDGAYTIDYGAVSKLEDVTSTYAGNENYDVPAGATKGYAYKFTLRDDLKWDDGTAIHAEDFVYTMKQQEDPEMWNYRADSFYNGSTVIHNARNYLYQGQEGYFASKSLMGGVYDEADDDKLIWKSYTSEAYDKDKADEVFGAYDNSYIVDWFISNNPDYKDYVTNYGVFVIPYLYGKTPKDWKVAQVIAASAAMDGKTMTEIKADATLKGYWDIIDGWWQTDPGEELDFFVSYYQYPAMSFDKVGLFVGSSENELIIVLDKSLSLFKEDGVTLSYHAAYNFSGLPLVHKAKYEANRVDPATEGGLYTSKYNSSVESTASWGPYKLTYFQAGKQYVLERNNNWYGYNMPVYAGQYQTDRIICDTVSQWNTAWLMFQRGDLASIGIDVSVADDYKNSSRAVFTADDYVASLQLQSDAKALAKRSTSEKNKMLLKYDDFRKALSLAINREDYAAKCTTASLAGYGLFNSMHYFDVENGVVYRDTDQAKEALIAAYGVDLEEFGGDLDLAIASIKGNNLELARSLLTKAYNDAVAAGDITATDKVVLTYGSSVDSESVRRNFDYLKKAFELLAVGTPLEGRFTIELDTSFGSSWANSFRDGEYDICAGGWSGAAWDPGYLLMAYLSPDYMYSQGWDTASETLEYNPWGDSDPDHVLKMSLIDWWNCLNGVEGAAFDWSDGSEDDGLNTVLGDAAKTMPDYQADKYWSGSDEAGWVFDKEGYLADYSAWFKANAHPVTNDLRLGIIAQLEQRVLEKCYTVPLYNFFSASLRSYKIEYITNTYNTFMAYGGIRYITYNYTDAEWNAVKANQDYKK